MILLTAFTVIMGLFPKHILENVGVKHPAYWCNRNREDALIWRLHELYMLMLILVIPTAVMAVTYTSICWEIWSVMQARYDMTSGKATLTCENFPLSCKRSTCSNFKQSFKVSQEENNTVKQDLDVFLALTTASGVSSYEGHLAVLGARQPTGASFLYLSGNHPATANYAKVVKMLVMIVVVFVVCWTPMLIDNCLTSWQVLPSERPGSILKHMYTTFTLMAYFNSCVNPIVYGFMSKNFRESFQKALCVCWRKPPRRQLSVSQTRTTSLRYDRSSALLPAQSLP